MKEGDIIKIEGRKYRYDSSSDRLELIGGKNGWDLEDGSFEEPSIACPKCRGFSFRIGYGEWECIAYCPCGHSMTIYAG